jgi:anti-sigma factor RsiW
MTQAEAELTCRELVELVTDHLEGRLPPGERLRFDAHLAGCDGCRAYLEQMRGLLAAAGRLREESLAPRAREELLAAFRGWRRGGGGT